MTKNMHLSRSHQTGCTITTDPCTLIPCKVIKQVTPKVKQLFKVTLTEIKVIRLIPKTIGIHAEDECHKSQKSEHFQDGKSKFRSS